MIRRAGTLGIAGVFAALGIGPAAAQEEPARPPSDAEAPPETTMIVEDFEGPNLSLRYETVEAPWRLDTHDLVEDGAFEGRWSERIQFVAGPGSGLFYSYPIPRIPIRDDLRVSVWIKANRPGMRLVGRVVLPEDIDPETSQPFYVNIQGNAYEQAGPWARLDLVDLVDQIKRRAHVLRFRTNRPIRLEGAYLETLALNLYGGVGETEVLVDALEIGPVPRELAESERPRISAIANLDGEGGIGGLEDAGRDDEETAHAAGRVLMDQFRLKRLDEPTRSFQPWFPTIIDAPGADIETLRVHGFDVYAARPRLGADAIEQAVEAGFLLMPMIGNDPRGLSDAEAAIATARDFLHAEEVAFWHLGRALGEQPDPEARLSELKRVREAVVGIRARLEPGVSRLATAGLAGELPLYARRPGQLALMGAHGQPWGSSTQPTEYVRFLAQRRDLTGLDNPKAFYWTWIPATAPSAVQTAIWGREVPPPWGRPRVQPAQIRMAAYAALMAGFRGLGVRGDAELTRAPGRGRLIELALLNAEIDLFQGILAQANGASRFLDVYPAPRGEAGQPIRHNYNYQREQAAGEDEPGRINEIQAAAFTTPDRHGTLVLLSTNARDAQWQPGQLARREIRFLVPGHRNASAWRVSLGGVEDLTTERVPGGLEVRVPSFGPTAIIVVTTDHQAVLELGQLIAAHAPKAAELAIEQAEHTLRYVSETHSRMVSLLGEPARDGESLLDEARGYLETARADLTERRADEAFRNARHASRPLRRLMELHYRRAVGDLGAATQVPGDPESRPLLVAPVSAPPLMSFNTLPQFYKTWLSAMTAYTFGANLLPSGDFEETDPAAFAGEGWRNVGYQVEGLRPRVENLPADELASDGNRRILKLSVAPEEGRSADDFAPFQDHLIAAVESPPVKVRKHNFVRISVLVKMKRPQPWGAGGVVVRDSLGGELMQFRRSVEAIREWSRVVLYRRAPEDGELTVTLGLAATGGEAYFDDLRIEPIVGRGGPSPAREAELGARPSAVAPRRVSASSATVAPR